MLPHARSLVALAALLALPLHNAAAHPRLVKATPAADSRTAVAPTEISLTFNEPLTLALSRITLLDAAQ
ncbi:MAG: copper resistance protein CopC, partial [Gemmatimonadetes bacterium]|nr:copper resistance protein CopC [Gemmatimonadota bacterium]